jgi:hypothetical protein
MGPSPAKLSRGAGRDAAIIGRETIDDAGRGFLAPQPVLRATLRPNRRALYVCTIAWNTVLLLMMRTRLQLGYHPSKW